MNCAACVMHALDARRDLSTFQAARLDTYLDTQCLNTSSKHMPTHVPTHMSEHMSKHVSTYMWLDAYAHMCYL